MNANFLNYFTMTMILRKFIMQFRNGTAFLPDRPNIPFHMQIYTKPLKVKVMRAPQIVNKNGAKK